MPHEVDMTKALIMSLDEWRSEQSEVHPISEVVLQVGEFTCVEPDLLVKSFTDQRTGWDWLHEAQLIIKNIPFVAYCETCDNEYQPRIGIEYVCPSCQAPLHNIRSGRELKIESIEWKVDRHVQ